MTAAAFMSGDTTAPVEVAHQATGVFSLLWLLVALPLASALLLLAGGRRTNTWGPYLGVAVVWVGFAIGFVQFVQMLGKASADRPVGQTIYTWAAAGVLDVKVQFLLDQLSMVFLLLEPPHP